MIKQDRRNILILGGTGNTGRLIVRHLLEQSPYSSVTIASRHPDQANSLADTFNQEYPGHHVRAAYTDAANARSLRQALHGQALMIVASPTTAYAESVIKTALNMGVDYLDVQLSEAKLSLLKSLAGEITSAGRIFITEAGFHPGLPLALVRYAASRFDTLQSAISAGYLNMGQNLPYTDAVDELIELFKNYQGQVLKDGKWTRSNSWDMRKIDFGEDIGSKMCYSMFLEELRPLPDLYPSLQEAGFYISESHWMVDWVIMPIIWMWLKLMPKAVRPIGRLLWWGMGSFHKPPYRVELQVQASGVKDGIPVQMSTKVSHPDGYELTAIPVVACVLQYLDYEIKQPGLWLMGQCVEPRRLLEDMQAMGVNFKSNEQSAIT